MACIGVMVPTCHELLLCGSPGITPLILALNFISTPSKAAKTVYRLNNVSHNGEGSYSALSVILVFPKEHKGTSRGTERKQMILSNLVNMLNDLLVNRLIILLERDSMCPKSLSRMLLV